MEEVNNQPGFTPPTGEPEAVSPVSPSFVNNNVSSMPQATPMPNNPPIGETAGTFVPPPMPPAPTVTPVASTPVMPPPPKQVDIRTMASDESSFRASGGVNVMPQTMRPAGKTTKSVDSVGVTTGGDKKKALLIGLGIVVFLAAAAAVANYFVLPMFLPDVQPNEVPVVTPESPIDVPEVTPTIPTTPTLTHNSYFDTPVDVSTEVNVSSLSLNNLNAALDQVAASKADGDAGKTTEFQVTQGLIGSPVTTDEFLAVLLPDVQFVVPMEEDFTGFMYDTGTEVRAGYIFALDAETTDLDAAQTVFKDTFESSTSLANLFLNDPGTPSTEFKDGAAVDGVKTRWLSYSNSKTSIDYGWKGSFVVISTSFDGFKEVVPNVLDAIPVAESTDTESQSQETATTTEI